MQPEMRRFIDETVERLARAKFVPDPSLGPRVGWIGSIVGSVQKRHGAIVKQAFLTVLATSRFEVWAESDFAIQPAADQACDLQQPRDYWTSVAVPYQPGAGRSIHLDMLVWNPAKRRLSAYQIKRGNGRHDAGKMRQVVRDLICAQIQLRSYGASRNLLVRTCSAHLISYYGREEQAGDWTLDRTQLDQHFGVPVLAQIEEINEYYRSKVEAVCAASFRSAKPVSTTSRSTAPSNLRFLQNAPQSPQEAR